ncbi:MAG: hypothetical protein QOE48_3176 [Mycobacterium sp.]|nr:hypothetical protein [Mycobacterium sp.]
MTRQPGGDDWALHRLRHLDRAAALRRSGQARAGRRRRAGRTPAVRGGRRGSAYRCATIPSRMASGPTCAPRGALNPLRCAGTQLRTRDCPRSEVLARAQTGVLDERRTVRLSMDQPPSAEAGASGLNAPVGERGANIGTCRFSLALSGEGARRFGGRWNPPLLFPAIYLADSARAPTPTAARSQRSQRSQKQTAASSCWRPFGLVRATSCSSGDRIRTCDLWVMSQWTGVALGPARLKCAGQVWSAISAITQHSARTQWFRRVSFINPFTNRRRRSRAVRRYLAGLEIWRRIETIENFRESVNAPWPAWGR